MTEQEPTQILVTDFELGEPPEPGMIPVFAYDKTDDAEIRERKDGYLVTTRDEWTEAVQDELKYGCLDDLTVQWRPDEETVWVYRGDVPPDWPGEPFWEIATEPGVVGLPDGTEVGYWFVPPPDVLSGLLEARFHVQRTNYGKEYEELKQSTKQLADLYVRAIQQHNLLDADVDDVDGILYDAAKQLAQENPDTPRRPLYPDHEMVMGDGIDNHSSEYMMPWVIVETNCDGLYGSPDPDPGQTHITVGWHEGDDVTFEFLNETVVLNKDNKVEVPYVAADLDYLQECIAVYDKRLDDGYLWQEREPEGRATPSVEFGVCDEAGI